MLLLFSILTSSMGFAADDPQFCCKQALALETAIDQLTRERIKLNLEMIAVGKRMDDNHRCGQKNRRK